VSIRLIALPTDDKNLRKYIHLKKVIKMYILTIFFTVHIYVGGKCNFKHFFLFCIQNVLLAYTPLFDCFPRTIVVCHVILLVSQDKNGN